MIYPKQWTKRDIRAYESWSEEEKERFWKAADMLGEIDNMMGGI